MGRSVEFPLHRSVPYEVLHPAGLAPPMPSSSKSAWLPEDSVKSKPAVRAGSSRPDAPLRPLVSSSRAGLASVAATEADPGHRCQSLHGDHPAAIERRSKTCGRGRQSTARSRRAKQRHPGSATASGANISTTHRSKPSSLAITAHSRAATDTRCRPRPRRRPRAACHP